MKLKILAFGIAKDIFGSPEIEINLAENSTVKDLKMHLENIFSQLKSLKSYFVAVDEDYAEDHQTLTEFSEIAIIPPVSGG